MPRNITGFRPYLSAMMPYGIVANMPTRTWLAALKKLPCSAEQLTWDAFQCRHPAEQLGQLALDIGTLAYISCLVAHLE